MMQRLWMMASRFRWLALAASAATALLLAARILTDPTNHVGWDPRLAIAVFVAGAVASWATWSRQRAPAWLLLACLCLVLAALTVAVVEANVLVPYELWLKRGLPKRPF